MYSFNPMHPFREEQLLAKLMQVFSENSSRQYLQLFKEIDPTSTGKYVPWLVKLWLTQPSDGWGQMREWIFQQAEELEEDAETLHELLVKFHRFKNQLPVEQRDILRHTKGSLAMSLKDFELPEGTKNEVYEKRVAAGRKILHQDDNIRVVQLTTPEAARRTARGTAWCVSSLKTAADYIASGPLVVFEQWEPLKKDFFPIALAHHGYTQVRAHPEADYEYVPTSQVKDTRDEELSRHNEYLFKLLLPYIVMAFSDVKRRRMRKIADAYEAQIAAERAAEPDSDAIRTSMSSIGSLESGDEYYTRLIDMAANLFGYSLGYDRIDPEIEEIIFNSKDPHTITQYLVNNKIIDENLEKYLVQPWQKRAYVEMAYRVLCHGSSSRVRDNMDEWIKIAHRVHGTHPSS